ncbi:hypothetical protein PIIN_11578 [Serendipita indica DSM 11827]|uniref:Uncharacterized protein n=1 Tax=Serendipita indica (strain DSM 11827) TaxID=1109443 RepID=G4U208_SERID|nr:hypothetical protein PIIN_11578 [Serendipita indica DSM 11827]
MLLYNFFAGLAVAASTANAYSYVTVASTTTTVAGTPTATATPTPTSLSRSTSACVGWSCGASTSCLPATTKVVYSICNEKCLGKSTTTSTFTTRPPPITATVPCGVKYLKRALYVEDEPELEKRWT